MEQPLDVKSIRETLGIKTQTELADLVGVDQGTVSAWEAGKHTPTRAARKTLQRLLEAHGGQAA